MVKNHICIHKIVWKQQYTALKYCVSIQEINMINTFDIVLVKDENQEQQKRRKRMPNCCAMSIMVQCWVNPGE